MTEDEWFKLGADLLDKWVRVNNNPAHFITAEEESAFEYAWELAWENRKALQ